MSYLPRPTPRRTQRDVDEIYQLTVEALREATTPEKRREAFQAALLRSYEAGVDAQRDIVTEYAHTRPTPVPPPPVEPSEEDPGTLPDGRPLQTVPEGAFTPPKTWKRT
jgi:hypothetical protein